MKKIYLLVSMLLATLLTQAQWTDGGTNLTTTDSVGIGTTTPSSYLEVKNPNVTVGDISTIANFTFRGSNHFGNSNDQQTEGKLVFSSQAFSNAAQKRAEIGFSTSGYFQKGATLKFYTTPDDGSFNPTSRMVIDHNGYVGIGTLLPSSQLEVRDPNVTVGDISTIANFTFRGSNHFGNGTNQQTEGKLVFSSQAFSNDAQKRAEIGFSTSGNFQKGATLKFYTSLDDGNFSPTARMMIDHNGKVAIGTSDFSGSHLLRVHGSIGAREIKVEATGWSDFVFERDYELRTLEEVEQHINENGHLPEIPSEAEVTENGINLGEMDARLLQKIEELTLYLIEQNKKIEALEQKVKELEKD